MRRSLGGAIADAWIAASSSGTEVAPADAIVPMPSASSPAAEFVRMNWARKVSRTYPSDTISPANYKDLIRLADQGSTWQFQELLDDVQQDAHVGAVLRNMRLDVAGAPDRVEPGEETDAGRAIAEAAQKFIDTIPRWRQLKNDLVDAEYRGFSCVQPDWRAELGAWWIKEWESIEARFFRFDYADQVKVETLDFPGGQPLPEGAIFHVARDGAGTIMRGGIGRAIAKLWIYKSYALIDTASFIERFGHPYVTVNLPPAIKDGSDELRRAKDAALSIMADQIGLVPAGVTLAFQDVITKAATVKDVYIAFMQWCDEGISKSALGGTLTVDSGEGGLGHGMEAGQHGANKQMLKEFRAGRLEETIQKQILDRWTVFHYGPNVAKPRYCIDVGAPKDEKAEAEAKKTRADTIAILRPMLSISKNQLRTEFDLEEPVDAEDTLEPAAPPPAPGMPGAPPSGALPPGAGGDPRQGDAQLNHLKDGACPHCGGFFTLSEAQKKKRSMVSVM